MTEEIVNPENEELESQVETPEKQNGDEKKFSQAELTRMIQTRVKKEKDTAKKSIDEYEARVTELTETNTQYEKILGEMVSKQIQKYPSYVQTLLEKLPLLDKLSWLADEKNRISEKEFPPRKQAEGNLEEKKTPPKPKAFM